jgi:predicted dehydrogenase
MGSNDMAENRLRIGVAGLGRIGWAFHCKTLGQHPDFELVAAQDVEPERRREAEATYGAKAYSDFAEMLCHPGLDVITIATPTHLHRDMAQAALRAGLHVVLEKPMAATSEDAEAIVRSAARHKSGNMTASTAAGSRRSASIRRNTAL